MIKYLCILMFSLFTITGFSQVDNNENIVHSSYPKMIVNDSGDTLVLFTLEQSKVIVADLMKYEIADSLVTHYMDRDSINVELIAFHKETIDNLNEKIDNLNEINSNNQEIIDNKNAEIEMKDEIIAALEKEVKKQKLFKWLAIAGGATLEIVTIVLLAK